MNQTSRLKMIARPHPQFSIVKQCALLKVPRSTLYYKPQPVSDEDLKLMRRIDEIYTKWPFYGSRRMVAELRGEGHDVMLLPRGGRKTSLGAGLGLFHSIGPERVPGGLALFAASDREQARIGFEEAAGICREDPRIESVLRFVDYRHMIEHPKSGCRLRATSSDAARSHGTTPTFALVDELHA